MAAMSNPTRTETAPDLRDMMTVLGRTKREVASLRLERAPLLAAVRSAGTAHLYADSADVEEITGLVRAGEDAVLGDVDGNTANQPLVRKVIERYLDGGDPVLWAERLRRHRVDEREVDAMLYGIVLGRVASDITAAVAGDRAWEISVQPHMSLAEDPGAMVRMARLLRWMMPGAFVKVPFAPNAPACLLAARDLERDGIPVNLTSTFSARQVVAAALLADVTRTNVFMGRLDEGLDADLLGAHVCLEAQRALVERRRRDGVKTKLIAASVRGWEAFTRVAGCDCFTAPCDAIRAFLAQGDVGPGDVQSRLETSYADRLGVGEKARERFGDERLALLYDVKPEFVEFLTALRGSREYASMDDGDDLYCCFDDAGFGDVFYSPMLSDREELREGKLPDLGGDLVNRLAPDTLFTLHANADFERHQEAMDEMIRDRLR